MDDIKKFKEINNGSYVKYSVKDLVAGIHTKLDRIENSLANGQIKFAKIDTTQKIHRRLIIGIGSALAGFLYLILQLTNTI